MTHLLTDIGLLALCLLLVAAFVTSIIHGATGIAGGFLLTVVAAPILGFKAVIPVLSITLLISHGSRALFNMKSFDKSAYFSVVLPAIPFIIIAATIYGRLSNAAIALTLGTVVLLSIPLRRYTKAKEITTSRPMLRTAGAVYGGISGLSIGPGMLLMPFLLGLGMDRQAFVATLAAIALTTNIVRSSVYGLTDMLNAQAVLLGLLTGFATILGSWLGRGILRRMTDRKHIMVVEILVIAGALNFYWSAYRMIVQAA